MCPSKANILLQATYIPDILLFKFKQKTAFWSAWKLPFTLYLSVDRLLLHCLFLGLNLIS